MRIKFRFFIRLAVAVGVMAIAHNTMAVAVTDSPAAEASPKVKANKRVCKKIKPTGSHLPQKICLKKKDWDAIEEAAREKLRNAPVGDRGAVSQ